MSLDWDTAALCIKPAACYFYYRPFWCDEIYLSERKIVCLQSHHMAALAWWRSSTAAQASAVIPLRVKMKSTIVYKTSSRRLLSAVTQQIVVPTSAKAQVLVSKTALRFPLIWPSRKRLSRLRPPTARRVMSIPSRLPFYFTDTNCLRKPRHLQKHMVAAHAEPSTPIIYHYQPSPSNSVAKGPHEKREYRLSFAKTVASYSKKNAETVHNKPSVDWAKKMEQEADVEDKNSERLTHG